MKKIELFGRKVSTRVLLEVLVIKIIISLVIAGLYLAAPGITGFFTVTNQFSFEDNITIVFNESANYTWIPNSTGSLQSLKVSGYYENGGTAKIYLWHNDTRHLIFDSGLSTAPSISDITGFVVLENETAEEMNTPPQWNSAVDSFTVNETIVIDLSEYFIDADNDPLIYSTSEVDSVTTEIETSIVTITPDVNIETTTQLTVAAFDSVNITFKTLVLEIDTKGDVEEVVETEIVETEEIVEPAEIAPIGNNNSINEEISNGIENNETIEENETIIEEITINETVTLNESIENSTIINETTQINETEIIETEENVTKTIEIDFSYKSDSIYDIDNNGIETTDGVIDLTVEDTAFNWNVNEENLCTRYAVSPVDSGDSTFVCYGEVNCCGFLGLTPSGSSWNDTFYNYFGLHGASYSNLVSAQVVHVDYNVSEESPFADIVYSNWSDLSTRYYVGAIPFTEVCEETCTLFGLNETKYTLEIEVNNTVLTLNTIDYIQSVEVEYNAQPELTQNISNITIVKNTNYSLDLSNYFTDPDSDLAYRAYDGVEDITVEIDGNIATLKPDVNFTGIRFMYFIAKDDEVDEQSNIFRIDVVDKVPDNYSVVEIGKPVKWKETIKVNDSNEKVNIKLPQTAANISVTATQNNTYLKITDENIVISDKGENKSVSEFERDREVKRVARKLELVTEAEVSKASRVVIDDEIVDSAEISDKIKEYEDRLENITEEESSKIELGREIEQDSSLGSITGAVIGLAQTDTAIDNETTLVVNESADEITVEYVTDAPYVVETLTTNGKQVKIVSEEHYENVSAYTDLQDINPARVKLYWIKEGTRVEFMNVVKLDTNLDGLTDRLEWTVPHLSNQTFEVEITVLNVQSYPTVGGNWTVLFNTTGKGNLTIIGLNQTTYTELYNDNSGTIDDLTPFELSCGSYERYSYTDLISSDNVSIILANGSLVDFFDTLGESVKIKGMYVSDYRCEEISTWRVRVLTPGVHNQQFNFSGQIAYANNDASETIEFIDYHEDNFTNGTVGRTIVVGSAAFANVTLSNQSNYSADNYTVLLLHMNGTDASTSFYDDSPSGFSVTVNDGAQIDTAQSKTGGSSAFFDGSSDYLSISDSPLLDPGADDFTVDMWVRFDSVASEQFIVGKFGDASNEWKLRYNGAAALQLDIDTSGTTHGSGIVANRWYHIAVVFYSGNSAKVFIDGEQAGNTVSVSYNIDTGGDLEIGRALGGQPTLDGWIDEFRISKGIARWDSDFTPPGKTYFTNQPENFTSQTFTSGEDVNWTFVDWNQEAPYQKEIGRGEGDGNDANPDLGINTSGLVALYHFNNESEYGEGELDALSYDFSVEANKNRSAGRSNNVTCSECPSVNASGRYNGSYDYDGANHYFSFADDLSPGVGTDPFSLTAWVYPDDLLGAESTYGMGIMRSTTGDNIGNWMFSVGQGGAVQFFNWRSSGADADGRHVTTDGDVVDRVWQHITAVYDGTNHRIYVNGEEKTTSTASTASGWDTGHEVGRIWTSAAYHWDGLIDEVAIWNRSLSQDEILKLYKRGVLKLNLSTRTSNDTNEWSDWKKATNSSGSFINERSQYLQYRASFETEDANYTSILNNVSISFSSFAPSIQNISTVPLYPQKDRNTTLFAEVSDDSIVSVNFTLIDPSGSIVFTRNGSNNGVDNNWNTTYNLTSYGTWLWNVSAFDTDGLIINSTTQEIILMQITAQLNTTATFQSGAVYVAGHINLSNNTNVSDTRINIYLDGDEITGNNNITDTSDSDFNAGTLRNVSVQGTGGLANITLFRNNSNYTSDGNTSLLLHFNGTDASTSFYDDGATGHTITLGSDPAITTSESKIDGSSADLDGNDYFSISAHEDFIMGSDDFTIEFWVKHNAIGSQEWFVSTEAGGGQDGVTVYYDSSGIRITIDDDANTFTGHGLTTGEWQHIAAVRRDDNVYLYMDGVQIGDGQATTADNAGNSFDLHIGRQPNAGVGFIDGYIDELRISKNISRYKGNFTPNGFYERKGNFTSRVLDASGIANWSYIDVTAEVPENKFVEVYAGGYHTCGLTTLGQVFCFGYNANGMIGDSTTTSPRLQLTSPDIDATFTHVQANDLHSCGLLTNGSMYCWGYNANGALGDGSTTQRTSPVQIDWTEDENFTSISVGGDSGISNTCGILTNNSAYCWGYNGWGAVGDGTNTERTSPQQILWTEDENFTKISKDDYHTCGLLANGSVYCWGYNGHGQLGTGGTSASNFPVQIAWTEDENFTDIDSGGRNSQGHTCGIITNGTVYCWGVNSVNQLGDSTTTQRTSPQQILWEEDENFTQISAGAGHTCGLLTNNTVYCWGQNTNGQLGDSTTTQRASPKQILWTNEENFTTIEIDGYTTSGEGLSCGLLTNGSAYCWGHNGFGQTGIGTTTTPQSSPVQVNDRFRFETTLDIAVRSSNDSATWSDWSHLTNLQSEISERARFVQYSADFFTPNASYRPTIFDVTINYTGTFTDYFGNYNYTFTAPESGGTSNIKVNTTYDNTISGEAITQLAVVQPPVIENIYTIPLYLQKDRNTTLFTNVSDDNIASVNFTLTDPSGTVVFARNGSNNGNDNNWNTTYNLTSYGTWVWNVSAFDVDGFIINSSRREIILMQIAVELNASSTFISKPIYVAGHVNLSNGTNVSSAAVGIYLNNTQLGAPASSIDVSSTDFNEGTYQNTTTDGTNVTLRINNTAFTKYAKKGNFSKVIDAGSSTTWTTLKWSADIRNTSDVLGIVYQNNQADAGVFYRNGSYGADTAQTDFSTDIDFSGSLLAYTLPAGFEYDDILALAMDGDASNEVQAFMYNGTALITGDVGGFTSDVAFTSASTWSIAGDNVNTSDILGFVTDSSPTDAAVFLRNGTFVWDDAENPPFVYDQYLRYTYPSDVDLDDIIGFAYDLSENDVAMFLKNGSIIADLSQTNLQSDIDFVNYVVATYNDGLNITAPTNITLQVRNSSDNISFSEWSEPYTTNNLDSENQVTFSVDARYMEYLASFETNDPYVTPRLKNVTVTAPGISTDSFGNYNYTFTSFDTPGTYSVKVNTTYENIIPGETIAQLTVAQAPSLSNLQTVPEYPRKDQNVTLFATVTDDILLSVNFTLIDPSGTVVFTRNGTNNGVDNNWNTTYNLTSYGTWVWNVSAFDVDGFIINSSRQEIILMQVTAELNTSTDLPNGSVYVAGHINLSNGTNVSNTAVNIFQNGTQLGAPASNTDTSSTDFNAGTYQNTTTDGANVTLTVNDTAFTKYSYDGNFSKVIDAGLDTTWTTLSWSADIKNTTDVIGIVSHESRADIGIFYRNGSYGADTDQTDFSTDIDFSERLHAYTLVAGYDYDDILQLSMDGDDSRLLYAHMYDGTILETGNTGDFNQDISFTVTDTWSITGENVNTSDIVGFVTDGAGTDSVVFLRNGTFVWDNLENPPFVYDQYLRWTYPSNIDLDDVIGFAYDTGADDVAMFLRNGSVIVDLTQTNFQSDVAFADYRYATYNQGDGLNITAPTNITLQVRNSSDNITFSEWSEPYTTNNLDSENQVTFSVDARYMEYLASFETNDPYVSPRLEEVTISAPGVLTDSFGNYNYTFTALDAGGTFNVKVNTTYSGTIPGEAITQLTLQKAPFIENIYTIPSYPIKDRNTTLYAGVVDANIVSVNFTLTDPSGTVVFTRNGSNNGVDSNWNTTYNLTSYGTWVWNVSAIDADGFITNSTRQEIILMQATLDLNASSPYTSATVYASGHINLSNNTNVSNTRINLFVNEAELSQDQSVNYSTTADFSSGIFFNTSADNNNITLLPQNNATLKRAKAGNYTQTIDAGANAVWSSITWSSHLKNTTDILGALYDITASDLAVFQRNGSYNTDPSGALQAEKDIVNSRLYNLLAGFEYDDIIGFVDSDYNSKMVVFFRNGSNLIDLSQAAPTGTIAFDDNQNTFTVPSGVNLTDAIDVIYDEDSSEVAMFLNDGTYIADNNVVDFEDTDPNFASTYSYTIPSDFTYEDIVGFVSEDDLDDIAVIFKNGSIVVDTDQGNYDSAIAFTEYYAINFAPNTNTSATTNVSVQVRTSDDNIAYSDWSNFYTSVEGESTTKADIEVFGRYLQYNFVLKTPNPYETPAVENVSLNYSALATDSFGNYNVTFVVSNTSGTYHLKVNTTFDNIIPGETITQYTVVPIITRLNITEPHTADVAIADTNLSINFTLREEDFDIIEGVTLKNVTVGGQMADILTTFLAGTPSGITISETTWDDANGPSLNSSTFVFEASTGSVTADGSTYYIDHSTTAEMAIISKSHSTYWRVLASPEIDAGNGRGHHMSIGTGGHCEQDICNTNAGYALNNGYTWCAINGGTFVLYRMDSCSATSIDTYTSESISFGSYQNFTFLTNASGVFVFLNETIILNSSDTTYADGGNLTISTGGGGTNRGSWYVDHVWNTTNVTNPAIPASQVQQFGYDTPNNQWQVNVTIPEDLVGLQDLYVNVTHGGVEYNQTALNAIQYEYSFSSTSTLPIYPRKDQNVTFLANTSINNILSIDFTLTDPSGTVVFTRNGTNNGVDNNWNTTYNLTEYGTWVWNVSATDSSGFITNSTRQEIILMQLDASLRNSQVLLGEDVLVSGSINLSNNTNVSDTRVNVYVNDEEITGNNNVTDTSDSDFNAGTVGRLDVVGSGAAANVTLSNQSNYTPDSSTVLLLHMNGTDASTSFYDDGSTGHTVTVGNGAEIDVAQSKIGASSAHFDGTTDYLQVADNSDWDFGTGEWTIDFWIRFEDVSSGWATLMAFDDFSNGMRIQHHAGGDTLYVYINGNSYTFSWAEALNTWYHLAILRDGNNLKVFVDGSQIGSSTDITSENILPGTDPLIIGAEESPYDLGFFGWLDELRITKGIARWTSDFTPPGEIYFTNQQENFTSQVFDSGGVSNWSNLNWNSFLTAHENIVGTIHDNGDTTIVYTRNGSYITDPTGDLNEDKSITNFNRYTILSDFSKNDIVGFVDDSTVDDAAVFFRNGSFIVDTTVPAWTAQIDFDDAVYAYTLPAGFNSSDILGFAYDLNVDDIAIFFTNGSYVSDITQSNLLSDIAFTNIHAYTIPSDFAYENIIGVAVDDAADDVAVFFKNGSVLVDTTQSAYTSDMAFTDYYSASYPNNVTTNKTSVTNLTIQVRTSNDSILFSNWGPLYVGEIEGSNNEVELGTKARYLQYMVVLSTEESDYSPILNNVTINYTGLFTDSFGNYNLTFTPPSTEGKFNIKVNTTYQNTIPGEAIITATATNGFNLSISIFTLNDTYANNSIVMLTDPPEIKIPALIGQDTIKNVEAVKTQNQVDKQLTTITQIKQTSFQKIIKYPFEKNKLSLLLLVVLISVLLSLSIAGFADQKAQAGILYLLLAALLLMVPVIYSIEGSGGGYSIEAANTPFASVHHANESEYNLSFVLTDGPTGRDNESNINFSWGVLDTQQAGAGLPLYSKFNGGTTDFAAESNIENVCGPTLEVSNNGIITWIDCTNPANQNFDDTIFIEKGHAVVSSEALHVTFDSAANITLIDNLHIKYPVIYKDGVECTDCGLISWNETTRTVKFNVTGFSNHSVQEANQSKIVNRDGVTQDVYVLVEVHYYNHSDDVWIPAAVVVNETTPRSLGTNETLKLDTLFNGLFNVTENATFGTGVYRVYAEARHENLTIINNADGTPVFAQYNFTYVNSTLEEAAPAPCDCPSSGEWNIDAANNCVLTSECNMQNNDVTCYGTGTWEISATGKVYNYNSLAVHQGCTVICRNSNGCFE